MLMLSTPLFPLVGWSVAPSPVGKPLPQWSQGYLDIHAVNTGQGECSFLIFPDGTSMLLDAGECRVETPNLVAPKPDSIQPPYITYTNYLKYFMKGTGHNDLDYLMLSHFHTDHMGELHKDTPKAKGKDYRLSGIVGVGDAIPFRKAIDRGWADSTMRITPPESKVFPNYRKFIEWQKANNNVSYEEFTPGRADQIVLTHNAAKYPNFQVRNIAANGVVWTGVADETRRHFAKLSTIDKEDWPDENSTSCAFRISYGPFDYFTGGDLPAVTKHPWQCLEQPVGSACGPVEAMKSCHHMNYDSMGVPLLAALRPQVVVVHNRKAQQPDIEVLRRIQSKTRAYAGDVKDVYSTNMHPSTPLYAYPNTEKMPATQGHIVIRVSPGGQEFYIYSLSDTDGKYTVTSVHGPYKCD